MKSSDLFKDIFSLAVRLLGLVFLYLGLRAVTPMLDLGAIETAGKSDVVTAILPIIFNLAVAWWLLGGGFLVRRAYPESSKIAPRPEAHEGEKTRTTKSILSHEMSDVSDAEKKLASLVEKPRGGRTG